MQLTQIETYLDSDDSQQRLKAIAQLRHHAPEVAVPLLKRRIRDHEFLVRSFVAMGLGNKRTSEAFEALLDLIDSDSDPNVRAEAANSLSKFGESAVPHLLALFEQDGHWLVRRSILAVLAEIQQAEVIFKICDCGIQDQDFTVREAAIEALGLLAGTSKQAEALQLLCQEAADEQGSIRARAARGLSQFDDPQASDALTQLQDDSDYRVVGAVLERLL